MQFRILVVLAFAFALGLLAGCGPATATVSGEVTIDGQPLDEGAIVFFPFSGSAADAVRGNIKDGKYKVGPNPGQYKVQISAQILVEKRKASDNPNAPFILVHDERLPDRYHSKTELSFDVKPGSNTKDWSLDSKAKDK
jgi:hypothetical protein